MALCQQPRPQRVSIAETYTQLVGGGGLDVIWHQPKVQRAAAQQPSVSGRASTAPASLRESTPALQRAGRLSSTVRPFDPAGVQAARQQRRASMAESIERARRVARAKWESERPSILAELKQNRPPSDDQRRQAGRRESSNRSSEPLGGVWIPPPAAAPEAGGGRAADEELARLRVQMQQMKQYVSTMEAMLGQQLASKAVAASLVGETTRLPGPDINLDPQIQVPLAPVAEDSIAEVESPLSNVDLDTQLLFETFETARHACAEVSEAEAEHGDMLERVSTSPLTKDKTREQSPLLAATRSPQVPSRRSPLGMLSVDPNNAATRTSESPARLQSTKKSGLHAASRGPVLPEPSARVAASPNLSSTDGGSPAAVVTYTEYSEYEEYADSSDGSPAAPGGVQVGAAVVENVDKALTVASEPVVMRGRLSF